MSVSQVLYLKYRPQSLDELIGQEPVKKQLLSAFAKNSLSHAYLFVGPRGTGKTSTARILAKMVNCEKPSAISYQLSDKNAKQSEDRKLKTESSFPCNQCDTCISITDGSNLDLIEIDAASNRGIDDIRALREKVKFAPTAARKKVYIIDEVHMLTTEAFNALLKTLEEPPAHALFALATTEVHKLPQTILSRVQRLDFQLASSDQLIEALKKVAEKEKLNIEEEALVLLARKAEGSFRDGVKLLDQLSSISSKITAKEIEESLKFSEFDGQLALLRAVGQYNTISAMTILSEQFSRGLDTKELMTSLMDTLRLTLFTKNGLGSKLVDSVIGKEKAKSLVELADLFTTAQLVGFIDLLQSRMEKLKTTTIPTLPLELTVVEMCQGKVQSSKFKVQNEKETQNEKVEDVKEVKVAEISKSLISEAEVVVDGLASPSILKSSGLKGSPQAEQPNEFTLSEAEGSELSKIKEKWTFVLETIRPYNFSLEALLRSVSIENCVDGVVTLAVPYSFHQRILEAPKNRDLVESILSDILGKSVRVSTVLGRRPGRREDLANIEVAADDEVIRVAAEIFSSDTVN